MLEVDSIAFPSGLRRSAHTVLRNLSQFLADQIPAQFFVDHLPRTFSHGETFCRARLFDGKHCLRNAFRLIRTADSACISRFKVVGKIRFFAYKQRQAQRGSFQARGWQHIKTRCVDKGRSRSKSCA